MYHPYAYIGNMTIKNLGANRVMGVSIDEKYEGMMEQFGGAVGEAMDHNKARIIGESAPPKFVDGMLRTIIPDAYEINITVVPLVKETKNFLFHSIYNDHGIYNVSMSDQSNESSSMRGRNLGFSEKDVADIEAEFKKVD